MQDFWLFFPIGFQHIADWQGYDHILFVVALCLRYQPQDWKKVLILITAFTIGHSVTLALSVLNYINVPMKLTELLIAVTIMITALINVIRREAPTRTRMSLVYIIALVFGLIHGLGFSNFLKGLLGSDTNIVHEMLGFNLGLEAGQILIVVLSLFLSWLFVNIFKVLRREYVLFVSGGIFLVALIMAIERTFSIINQIET
jgi:hydrogenase/urease accessory protein HupE